MLNSIALATPLLAQQNLESSKLSVTGIVTLVVVLALLFGLLIFAVVFFLTLDGGSNRSLVRRGLACWT